MSDEIKHLGPGEIHLAPPFTPPPPPPWAAPDADPLATVRALLAKPLITEEQARRLREGFEQLGRMATEAVGQLQPVLDSLREAGLIPEAPPEDPKAKALWLRQHRGTGPARPGPQHRRRTDQ